MSFSSSNCLNLEGENLATIQLGDRPSELDLSEHFDQGYVLKNRKEVVCDECHHVIDDVEAHDEEACREAVDDY